MDNDTPGASNIVGQDSGFSSTNDVLDEVSRILDAFTVKVQMHHKSIHIINDTLHLLQKQLGVYLG